MSAYIPLTARDDRIKNLLVDTGSIDHVSSGKVRDTYRLADGSLLLVASDRLSVFDVVQNCRVHGKGSALTALTHFWLEKSEVLQGCTHHLQGDGILDPNTHLPSSIRSHDLISDLRRRSLVVRSLKIQPVECIVRGYLFGSVVGEYSKSGTVCGISVPFGMSSTDKFESPLFTPSTKAEEGHDENITFAQLVNLVGQDWAKALKEKSLEVYSRAAAFALTHDIIIPDTKFEWGVPTDLDRDPTPDDLVLADEVLTPDSSRFWPKDEPGTSLDKESARDALRSIENGPQDPATELLVEKMGKLDLSLPCHQAWLDCQLVPEGVISTLESSYPDIFRQLTGQNLDAYWDEVLGSPM